MKSKNEIASLALALLLLLSACNPSDQQTQPEWQEFTSEAGFSVLMPGQPERETLRQENEGVEVVSDVYKVEAGSVTYMILVTPLQEEVLEQGPDAIFDQYRENILESTQAELTDERELSLGGHPGREISLDNPSETSKMRMYIVDGDFYQVVIAGPEEEVSRDAARFLDSFKLLE